MTRDSLNDVPDDQGGQPMPTDRSEQARPHMPVSFVAESNYGGIPITVCGCGVLLMTAMAETHAMACPVYLAHAEGVTS